MSIIGKLLKTGIDIATLPVSVAADVITMGGEMVGTESFTKRHGATLIHDVLEIRDEAEKL